MRIRVLTLNLALFILVSLTGTAHAFTITRVSGSILYRDGGAGLVGAYEGYRLTNDGAVARSDVWVTSEGFTGGASIQLASTEDGVQHIGPMAAGESKMAFFYLVSSAAAATAQSHTIRAYIPGSPATTLASQAFSFTAEETIQANANKVTVVTHTPSGPGVGGTLEITVKGATGTIGGSQSLAFTPASATTWRADAFQLETTTITFTGGNSITITDQLAFTVANSGDSDYTAKFTFRIVGVTNTSTPVRPIGYIESGGQIKHTSVSTTDYQAIPPLPVPVNRLTLSRSPVVSELPVGGGTVSITLRVDSTDTLATTIDKFVETTISGSPSYVAGSSKVNNVTVTDPVISGSTWTWSGSLSIPANGSIELTFQASYAASSGTHVQSGSAFVGPTQIDSTLTTGDDASPDLTVYVGTAPDTDSDGLSDAKELLLGTDPQDNDTDNDGITDGTEVGGDGTYNAGVDSDPRDADTDDDGLSDGVEKNGSGPLASFAATDPLDWDADDDGLSDGLEVGVSSPVAGGTSGGTGVTFNGTNTAGAGHYRADTEPSSTTDPKDADSDDDDLLDGEEDQNGDGAAAHTLGDTGTSGGGETDPNDDDTDGDGLLDGDELAASGPLSGLAATDPLDVDTDDGGIDDGIEVLTDSTDPNEPSDDTFCGSGYINGGETCDDGDTTGGDGCSATCSVETGYQCSGQPSVCTTVCGNGAIHGAEACDDGDSDSGDGCSGSCAIETGYQCSGQPSVCTTVCGNGAIHGAETCDD
ncbi:MAG TPA: DUF4215 domain-containing protein, partial [Polyangiales bacterium]|nr:DUF4215 domain-containing protein [Polyangiales bacterium]